MMNLFLVSIRSLKQGDQFKLDKGHSGHYFWEVFSKSGGNVYIFPTDIDLYREDGTMSRNIMLCIKYYNADLFVTPLVKKEPAANRKGFQYSYPDTFLNPDDGSN